MTRTASLLACAAIVIAGCTSEPDDAAVTDLESRDTVSEARAMDQALAAEDFADLQLGARIEGPQGPEVRSRMTNSAGAFADIRSFVACPAGMDPCDPERAPEGTVYTYVHVIYPGEDNRPQSGSGMGNDASDVERTEAFRMLRPATGFTGNVGYSKAEALAAIGPKADVIVSCDAGKLVWTVHAGDGGDQWGQAEPLTFWWQSTVPPDGPAAAYALDVDYTTANGSGPYPGKAQNAAAGCMPPAKSN